jgi:hypothetical protein
MRTAKPRTDESSLSVGPLYVGLELSTREWRLAYTAGLGARSWQTVIPAGDRVRLRTVLAQAKGRCGLTATAPVRSCYEAGRDAFWPHRLLEAEGVENVVVDSSSIEVSRRARRTKTDRLDAQKLVTMLVRWVLGDATVWHVVHVPSAAVEAARHAPRTAATLTKERTRWRNRIHAAYAAPVRSTAPAGSVPSRSYRHSAMTSLRASATMPTRRCPGPPRPNRRRYHCVRALSGCHCTHTHAVSTATRRTAATPARLIPCSWAMVHSGTGWR